MEEYTPETETDENLEYLYNISLLDEEYELSMKINGQLLEFKIQQKDIIDEYYYKSKFDLQIINELSSKSFKGIKEAFDFFDKIINEKKVKLAKLIDKIIMNCFIDNKEKNIEAKFELKQIKLTKDEMYFIFLKEINILKKELKSKNEKTIDELIKENNKQLKEYVDKKIEESKQEYIKIFEEKIKEKDNEINKLKEINEKLKKNKEKELDVIQNLPKQKITEKEKISQQNKEKIPQKNKEKIPQLNKEKEKQKQENEIIIKHNELNDNLNLINDFNNINIESMKVTKSIANNLKITFMKSVAVYKIIRSNDMLYEIAYPDNKNGYNIIIYNILNQNTNIIKNAHQNNIHRIKHYYDCITKNHILLTSSGDKSIKLWNISSDAFLNILHLPNCFDGFFSSPFCLMFNKGDYYILGNSWENKKNIWNKKGELIGSIEKSKLNYYKFIEATYIDNKPYILLSGKNHSECFDYNNNTIKVYQSNNKDNQHWIINLFNKNNKIYLISGDNGGNVIIFDFLSTNEIGSISIGGTIYSLCSINEKYILVGNDSNELKVIDFDNKSLVKKYQWNNFCIYGIEKIKTQESKEFIVTYDYTEIKLWE